jgi:hypothetical protein
MIKPSKFFIIGYRELVEQRKTHLGAETAEI